MTKAEKEAYLKRIKYTPPTKPDDKVVDDLKKMFGMK